MRFNNKPTGFRIVVPA